MEGKVLTSKLFWIGRVRIFLPWAPNSFPLLGALPGFKAQKNFQFFSGLKKGGLIVGVPPCWINPRPFLTFSFLTYYLATETFFLTFGEFPLSQKFPLCNSSKKEGLFFKEITPSYFLKGGKGVSKD